MNIYYLKRFRKRFKVIESSNNWYRLIDEKEKNTHVISTSYSQCVKIGIGYLIDITRLRAYMSRNRRRDLIKRMLAGEFSEKR